MARRRVGAAVMLGLASSFSAAAQTVGPAPGATVPGAVAPSRVFTPEQLGAISSSGRYLITSSANENGAFLWIIDSVDRLVTLCEKPGSAADFTCRKKPLP